MTREQARKSINSRPLYDFVQLEISKKAGRAHGNPFYICPVCGSGKGKNGTGAFTIDPETNRVICFSGNCFTEHGEDTLGALRIIWHCGETEALKKAGYTIDGSRAPEPIDYKHQKHNENKEHTEHTEHTEPPADHTSFYKQAHEELLRSSEAREYLRGRGISDTSIRLFNIGYCASWKHSKATEQTPPTRRIIIPRTARTYQTRRIDKPVNDYEDRYKNMLEGSQLELFNLQALEESETAFICEGELDAMSLYQQGAAAVVGIGTTTNAGRMIEEAKKHPEAVYILALDNDKPKENGSRPGRDAQAKLAAGLAAAGIAYIDIDPAEIYGDAKDANEALIKDPERLRAIISDLQSKARQLKAERDEARTAELNKRTGEAMLDSFILSVTDKEARTFEPIPTGIKDIDRALQGGLIRGTLATLGAPPAMGKTIIAQRIFENMAKNGNECLYINLEMSREQLLARSITRIAYKYEGADISALDILRGYEWSEDTRRAVMKAAALYKAHIAPRFIYNPDGVTNGLDNIMQTLEAETMRIKAKGKPAPLVCIDYLQLIDAGERDAIEGMKKTIFNLKDFAKRENTIVFVIIANNRMSNRTGTVEIDSGRDTSAIEYSGDLMLGIAYTAIEDRRTYETGRDKNGNPVYSEYTLDVLRKLKQDAHAAGLPIPQVCNEITMKVLKSRFTEDGHRADLILDGKHNSIIAVEKKFTPYQENYNF